MFYKILERKKKKWTEQREDNLNGITRITTKKIFGKRIIR